MAQGENITTRFKVDISDLKAGISEANRQIKLANAQFKAASAGMDDWASSTNGIKAKLSQLDNVLKAQKSKLQNYNDQLTKQKEAYNENGRRADELKAKLQQLADQGVAKTSAEYRQYQKALTDVEKEQNSNQKTIDNLNITILNQQAAVNKTEAEIRKYSDTLDQLETDQKEAAAAANKQKTAYEELESTIKDQQTRLDELKNKYSNVVVQQGKSSDAAKDLARDIDSLSGELADNKAKLQEADQAADELDNSLKDVGDSANNAGGGFTVFKGALANLVADGIRMATQAIKDFVTETINVGKEFDSSMSQVAAVSGATGDDLQALRDKAKEMGETTKFSASESADAFNYMAMAGWKTKDMLGGIEGVLNLAAAANTDLATTSDIVTDALTAFGKSASDAGTLADIMAAASSNANTNVEMMGATFKYVAPIAGAMGYSMEDTAVAIGLMANAGIKGEQAGTSLRSMLTRLAAPPKEAAEAMDALGISITNADGTMKPMSEVMEILRGKFDGLSESQQTQYAKALAGQEAMSGLLAIVNASPADFDKLTDAVNNSNGAAEKMAETMQDNLGGDMTKLGSQFEGLQIALYEKLEPALRKGAEALSKLLDKLQWVIDNGETITAIIIGVGTAVGTFLAIINRKAILTAFIGMLTKIKAGFVALNATMMANPIGLVVAAIAGLIAAFVYLWNTSEDFRNFWINLWDKIKKFVGEAVTAISEFFSELWEDIKEVWSVVSEWFDENVIQPIVEFFSGLWNSIKESASNAWEGIKEIWNVVSTWFNDNIILPVSEFFTGLWDTLKNGASEAWNGIKDIWNIVSSWFNDTIISPVKNFFTGMWDKLKSGAKDAWEGIKSVFSKVSTWFRDKFSEAWTKVKNVFSTGGKIFEGIKDGIVSAFKKVVNAIIRGINKVIAIPFNAINKVLNKIRNASFLGISPFKNLGSISVPQIPELAQGGVLKRGQVGLLEGNGAEAVVPLERNKKWISAVASDLLSTLKKQAGGGISNSNTSTSNVTNFTQIINAPKQPSRIELYRQTRNLLEFAKGDA